VLLDLAGGRDLTLLRRAWEGAQRLELLDVDAVIWTCANSPGRRIKPLKALIDEATDAPDTRSEFEDLFTDFLREHPDLPMPQRNVLIEGYVADAYFPGTGLIVELDSREWHWHRREQDSERDADLALAGYFVYRVTWSALTRHPERTAGKIRRLLRTAPSPTRAARAGGA
jgi:very-short-patch-repair endonuclease